MAKLDLSVDELVDTAVSKLGELLAPVSAFSILPVSDDRVKSTGTGGGQYQVEITDTKPTAAKNPVSRESMTSGTQTNVPVTTANVSVMQEYTDADQQQGIPFRTRIEDAAKAWAEAIWDDCTAMMAAGGFTDGGSIGAADGGNLTTQLIRRLRTKVDSNNVALIVEHAESENVYPDDRDSFGLRESGAWGFESIYQVSNFAGGVVNQVAFAADMQAAVGVTGGKLQDSQNITLAQSNSLLEAIPISSLGLMAELRVWQNTDTMHLFSTIEGVFGISAADETAAAYMTHDA